MKSISNVIPIIIHGRALFPELGVSSGDIYSSKKKSRNQNKLVQTISQRIVRYLDRAGLLVRDVENSYLQLEVLDASMDDLLGHFITYRIDFGPQAGRLQMPMLKDLAELFAMNGWTNICLIPSITHNKLQLTGFGVTIMTNPIWHWAGLPQNRSSR